MDATERSLPNHDVAAPRRSIRPRWPWAVVLSGAALFALGAAVVAVPPPSPPPDEVLDVRTLFSVAAWDQFLGSGTIDYLGLYRGDARIHEDFRGVSVWSGPTRFGTTCLIALTESADVWATGCAPPGADAVVNLNKYRDDLMPPGAEDPWGGMPVGSLLRFVLDDDDVDVWLIPSRGSM